MITPQTIAKNLSDARSISPIYLKREDTHPYMSHKGRAIPFMIHEHFKQGIRHFVISSSGNAALAALLYIQEYNIAHPTDAITLEILVGEHINSKKLETLTKKITDNLVSLSQVEKPKQTAFQKAKEKNIVYLRQSTDAFALTGYEELAQELLEIKNLSAVFIPTSSGTTAEALGKYFLKHNKLIQIHIVQTTACHPIAKMFDTASRTTDTSVAGAIVDNIAHRKKSLVDTIKQTYGFGWIVTDEEITHAQNLLKETEKIECSPNSALALAGLIKAQKHGKKFDGAVALLITGA